MISLEAMRQINLSNYKNLYIKTARKYINSLSVSCANLAENLQNIEAVKSLHISSHSLRSQSQVMGFTNMANLCRIIEKISHGALEGRKEINSDLIAVFKEAVEGLSLCLSKIEKKNEEADLQLIIKKLDAEINSA